MCSASIFALYSLNEHNLTPILFDMQIWTELWIFTLGADVMYCTAVLVQPCDSQHALHKFQNIHKL